MATSTQPQRKPFLTPREIIFGVVVVLIFAGLYALTLISYVNEGEYNKLPFTLGDDKAADNVVVNARMLSIDPVKGEVAIRVDVLPQGALTTTDGLTSTKSLKVLINGATGQLERTFDKGKTISPFDTVISLDGVVNNYPFDTYAGQLYVYVTSQDGKDAAEEEVPVLVNLTANIPGYQINAAADAKESTETTPLINMDASRSKTVVVVAIAGMIIMWAIGIAVIFLTMSFVFRSRKAEAFAFYSGLLFGLFGLRNSLPNTPPIGTQSDFLSFLWVEAIVAIMMVLVITISLVRPQK